MSTPDSVQEAKQLAPPSSTGLPGPESVPSSAGLLVGQIPGGPQSWAAASSTPTCPMVPSYFVAALTPFWPLEWPLTSKVGEQEA